MLWVLRAFLFQVNFKLIGRYDVYNTGNFSIEGSAFLKVDFGSILAICFPVVLEK